MPIIKSAIKAMKQNATARERNRVTKADFKSKVKTVRKDIIAGGKDADKLLASAIQAIDKAAKRGVIHKKTADRRKSRLMLAINKATGKPVVAKAVKVKTPNVAKALQGKEKPATKAVAKKASVSAKATTDKPVKKTTSTTTTRSTSSGSTKKKTTTKKEA